MTPITLITPMGTTVRTVNNRTPATLERISSDAQGRDWAHVRDQSGPKAGKLRKVRAFNTYTD